MNRSGFLNTSISYLGQSTRCLINTIGRLLLADSVERVGRGFHDKKVSA